jgi:hypothetical protein
MENARACFGVCTIQDQFIYVFGGLNGNTMLDSIERFDDLLQTWLMIEVLLPSPICKLGCLCLSPFGMFKSCMLIGGILEGQNRSNKVTVFECEHLTFTDFPAMQKSRSFNPNSGTAVIDSSTLIVIAGSPSGDGGEFFQMVTQARKKSEGIAPQWTLLPSHLTDFERQLEL